MLREALEWVFTPASPAARQLGYLAETIALEARFRRSTAAWASHLEASRRAIAEAAEGAPGAGIVLILGSGPLLDVPLGLLARRFERVILADIVHPWRARGPARRLHNVHLMEMDATGMADALAQRRKGDPPPTPSVPALPPEIRPDLTVSLNLLSQLATIPSRRLGLEGEAAATLHTTLVRAHLTLLRSLPGRVTLIADMAQDSRFADRVERWEPLEGLDLPAPDRSWDWLIAPEGERADGAVQTNHVGAWLDLGTGFDQAETARNP